MADGGGGNWGEILTSTPWGSVASPHILPSNELQQSSTSKRLPDSSRALLSAEYTLVDKPDNQPPTSRYVAIITGAIVGKSHPHFTLSGCHWEGYTKLTEGNRHSPTPPKRVSLSPLG